MSGRSAYVRKKITEPKTGEKGASTARGRSKSSSGHNTIDDGSVYDHPIPQGTGFGTTNARLLKFSDPAHDGEAVHYRSELANLGSTSGGSRGGSRGGSSEHDRRELGLQAQGPMPDYAYARARKPVLKTEDVSGIERSGFRNAVDKQSSNIRKGLTKAFTLGLKKKKEVQYPDRATSSVALRSHYYDADEFVPSGMPSPPIHKSAGAISRNMDHLSALTPPPVIKLPPVPSQTALPIKRWVGSGRPVQRWNKLRKDPELWDPNGDVLVYFGRKGQLHRPNPSFRLSSHIIEATESRALITLLREGSTEDEYSQISSPPSPVGAPPMLVHNSYTHLGQATPPTSDDNAQADVDGQISYEMYFPTPPNLTKVEAQRHAITTRNVFALFYHASLVGLSLFQALQDLLERLNTYMEPDTDNVGTILNYLSARGIDDARNDPETAVSMLAWSETPGVRWEEGWREAFLHCAGQYTRLEDCADFRHLTPITRALLERACLETQLRVQAAEERLALFTFADAWGPTPNSNTAKAAAERLQQFFIGHYLRTCGTWPPSGNSAHTADGEDMWLTRTMAQRLQKDFGALYDYLVNRDVVWDESEMRSSRKWMMVSESGNKSFEADSDDLPLTDLLIEFDNRMRFPHIPHPYPLVPDAIPVASSPRPGSARDKFRRDRDRDRNARPATSNDDRTLERRIQLSYTEASNIYSLGSEFAHSDLIESFVKFEKTDMIGAVNPFTARRGRWVLIYAILQTLASVSVDSPNARYKDGVVYHLSPRLRGTRTPPWKPVSSTSSSASEAAHELSHCWVMPRTWNTASNDSAESDASNGSGSGGGDPVVRMIRSRAHKFPRPPSSRASRSTHTTYNAHHTGGGGWQTPSMRSSATATPTMWGGSSAMSVYSDDTATTARSSGRILMSQYHQGSNHVGGYINKNLPQPPPQSRSHSRGPESLARTERSTTTFSTATFGPGSGFHNMPTPMPMPTNSDRERMKAANLHSFHTNNGTLTALHPPSKSTSTSTSPSTRDGNQNNPTWPTRTQSIHRTQPPVPLDLLSIGGVTGKGDFFADMPYTPTSPGSKGGDGERDRDTGRNRDSFVEQLPLSLGSEALGRGPVIRDFDELDSVVEESGFENRI
ncbi:hypothetical protein F4808DRAFT_341212 [Astrocystis sublimbata]|nr:hypothetical protein F4808DRAFT_341212 [Astrocystis sublimbata]